MANNGSNTTNTSGETNVQFDYTKKAASDCVSDKNMGEIARRLQGFLVSKTTGDVIFSQNPPNDKLKLWVEIDSTGAIVGTVKRYDSATGQWVDDHTVIPEPPGSLKLFIQEVDILSNDQTVLFTHLFDSEDYIYTVTNKTAPLAEARWYQDNFDPDFFTLHFLDMAGVTVEVRGIEYDNKTA